MRLLVKPGLSGQAPLGVVADPLPRHGKRGVNQDPPHRGAVGESAEEGSLLGLRVDGTHCNDHISIGVHPLRDEAP